MSDLREYHSCPVCLNIHDTSEGAATCCPAPTVPDGREGKCGFNSRGIACGMSPAFHIQHNLDHRFEPVAPAPASEPYKVEVDDHSEDCGTVYILKGPNVGIMSKDEEMLKERAEDFNLGFTQGVASAKAEVDRLTRQLSEAMNLLKLVDEGLSTAMGDRKKWYDDYEALKREVEK